MTSVAPGKKVDPDPDVHWVATVPSTTSEPLALKLTGAPLGLVGWTVMLPGTLTVGGVVSMRFAVAEPDPVTPSLSIAEHVIVVEPSGNVEPDARLHCACGSGLSSGSLTLTVKFTGAPPGPMASAGCWLVMLTVTVGAPFGLTVTVKDVVAELPASSVAVHVTVVVPEVKVEPEGGVHEIATDVSTSSVDVGTA